jgi:hypothetical protein
MGCIASAKNPGNSSASCFVALQQVLEPQIQHVVQVKQEKRSHASRERSGRKELLAGDHEPTNAE